MHLELLCLSLEREVMTNITQELAVIDPGFAWLLPLPKNGFTVPKFRFGQRVQSRASRDKWANHRDGICFKRE